MTTDPSSPPRRPLHLPLWAAAGLFAGTLAAYLGTLAPGLVRGDGAELQFTLATLGVAHPTGYPLYTLLGWLWSRLIPFGAIPWRINLLSAAAGAGAVVGVYAIGYRLTRRILPAMAGALFLAFSPTFWSLSSVTEVYALHALFVAAVLALLLAWHDAREHRLHRLVAVVFVYGLSLSHHRTMILLAPAMALFVLLSERDRRRLGAGRDPLRSATGRCAGVPRGTPGSASLPAGSAAGGDAGVPRGRRQGLARLTGRSLFLAGAFFAGLLPYAHVFAHHLSRGRTVPYVIWNVILGGDFAFFLGLRSDPLAVLWDLPRQQLGGLGLAAAGAGLAWLAWKQRAAVWLLGVSLAANLVFCLFYRVPDIHVFLIPVTLLLSVCAAASAGFLRPLLEARSGDPTGSSRRFALARSPQPLIVSAVELALVVMAGLSVRNQEAVQARVAEMDGDVEGQARALLAYPFEPEAVMIADWDTTMAIRFLRRVEGVPAGVQVNAVRLGEKGCAWLLETLAKGKTVYVAPAVQISRLPAGAQFHEAPPFIQITGRPAPYTRLDRPLHPQLTLEGVQRRDRLLILRWLVTGPPLAEDYTTYAHFFDAAGRPIGQQDKGSGEATCWYPPTAWTPGRVMQDLFILPAGTASVRAGAYALHGDQIEPLGTDTTFALP